MAVGVIETGDNRFAFTIDDFRIRTGDRIQVSIISSEKYPVVLDTD